MKRLILGAILSLLCVPLAHAACPAGATPVAAGQSLQAAVSAGAANARFCLANGVHRGQSAVPKAGQQFYGQTLDAKLNGSKVLPTWVADGSLWYAAGQNQTPPQTNIDECATGFPLCNVALAVFYADKPLLQVANRAGVNANTFWHDRATSRIYIGANPTGRILEVTTTEKAFHGTAANVLIKDLTIEKYGSKLQEAAIFGANATGWTIDNVTVQLSYAVGVDVGSNGTIRKSRIRTNGEMGVAGGGSGIMIHENDISNNGFWAGLDPKWEGGAMKLTEIVGSFVTVDGKINGTGATVWGNTITDNTGVGVWFDEGTTTAKPNSGVVVRDNMIARNTNAGMSFEISRGPAKAIGNTFVGNGTKDGWFWGGCLQSYDSMALEAYGNVCDTTATYGAGMMIILQGGRGVNACGNDFHDNTIILRGPSNTTGVTGDNLASFCGGNQNKLNRNKYYVMNAAQLTRPHWAWASDEYGWEAFRSASGQEAQGTVTAQLPPTTPVPPVVDPPVVPPTEPPVVVPPTCPPTVTCPPVVVRPVCQPGCVVQ